MDRVLKYLLLPAVFLALALFFTTSSRAMDVSFEWDANSEPDVIGYYLYYKENSGGEPYDGRVSIEGRLVTTYTLFDLDDTKDHYFVLTAYDDEGLESDYSVELVRYAVPQQYTLDVTPSGQGSVSPNGGTFDEGTVVELTATPDDGWTFDYWTGHLSGSANPETIIMNGDKSVTAVFTQLLPTQYMLTVTPSGQGTVSLSPGGGTYDAGTVVTLTASADSGWQFDHWTGDLSGSANPATITMNSDKSVTAVFTQLVPTQYTLTVTPSGQGTVSLSPGGGTYSEDTVVTLTASADSGWQFDHWTGDLSGSTNPATITMDSDKSVTAMFTQDSIEPEVLDTLPHHNAGITDDTRIPINTSFAVLIQDADGLDITEPTSVMFIITEEGHSAYIRDLNDVPVLRVVKLTNDDDTQVRKLWVVYDRINDIYGDYNFDTEVSIEVEAQDINGAVMTPEVYRFRTETSDAHDTAQISRPTWALVDPGDPALENPYDAGILVTSGELEGAKIIYDDDEPVKPEFGPIHEIPEHNVPEAGAPMNLQPPTVFNTPVKLFIPYPAYVDVSRLSVYMYNGRDWVLACDAAGNVLPGGDGWMVPGSRVNHNYGNPSTIEIKVYHFSAVQTGAYTSNITTISDGEGGSGGGCFIATSGSDH